MELILIVSANSRITKMWKYLTKSSPADQDHAHASNVKLNMLLNVLDVISIRILLVAGTERF